MKYLFTVLAASILSISTFAATNVFKSIDVSATDDTELILVNKADRDNIQASYLADKDFIKELIKNWKLEEVGDEIKTFFIPFQSTDVEMYILQGGEHVASLYFPIDYSFVCTDENTCYDLGEEEIEAMKKNLQDYPFTSMALPVKDARLLDDWTSKYDSTFATVKTRSIDPWKEFEGYFLVRMKGKEGETYEMLQEQLEKILTGNGDGEGYQIQLQSFYKSEFRFKIISNKALYGKVASSLDIKENWRDFVVEDAVIVGLNSDQVMRVLAKTEVKVPGAPEPEENTDQ